MSLSVVAQSIIDRLAPLRGVELIVRRQPNRLRSQGVIKGNGLLTLSVDSITGLASENDLTGMRQATNIVWLLRGQLRNVREQDGMDNLFDWLTEQLIGWTAFGASGPASLATFTPQRPLEDYWPIEFRFNVPLFLVGSHTFPLDNVPEAEGANLLEAVFEPTEITDRWGVYSDTTEVNPC